MASAMEVQAGQDDPGGAGGARGDATQGQFDVVNLRDLNAVFGEELLGQLAPEVRSALQEKLSLVADNVEQERARREEDQVVKEHKSVEVEHDLEMTRRRLENKIEECRRREKEAADLDERLAASKNKVLLLEETNSSLSVENGSLKRDRDQLTAERNDLFALAERRQQEIDRVRTEGQTVAKQLEEANVAKCEALVKAEDLASREVSLQYREKRMADEKEFLEGQAKALMEELNRRNEENIALRREQTAKFADLQSKLFSKTEEMRLLEAKQELLVEERNALKKKAEELTEKLRQARDSEMKVADQFRQELLAQTNLAKHYQSYCDESEQKAGELEKAVSELQGLVKKSEDRYGALEDNVEREKEEHKEEIQRRNEAIRALKRELEDANELIKTLKSKGLSPEGIENLSPSAAAASKLLKSGMSLTQVFSQLVSCQEELLTAKDENTRLNAYLEQILKEIEERAPALKQQREDYDRAVSAVNTLTTQLEDARQEYEFRKREAVDARQKMGLARRENERLTQQVRDLGRQVTVLVREVEAARSGRHSFSSPSVQHDLNRSSSDNVITERLLDFASVSELQQKNIELLAVVRELSSKQEVAESALVEEKTAELRRELENAMTQLEELRAARQRQETMVESIIIERDTYKTLATNAKKDQQKQQGMAAPVATSTPSVSSLPPSTSGTPSPRARHVSFQELEKRAMQAEKALKEVQKDFAEYKEEKHKNDEIVNKELSDAKAALNEARTKAIKLTSQDEYNTERFKIAQGNAEAYKKQAKVLEERSAKLSAIVAKHEETMEVLRNEVTACQMKQSQAEVELQHLRHERSILKAAEARMIQENEILHRQKNSSAMVMENLNLVKLSLEKAEEEKSMRLRNKNEDLEKEVTLLRKKIDAEQAEYKESVKAWEKSGQELREKLEEAQKAERERQEEIVALEKKMDLLRQELGETQEKLEMANSTLASKGVTAIARQDSNPEVSAKVRDLQMQLNQAKNEVINLKDQLAVAKDSSTHYKDIADSAEKRLTESNNASKTLKDDLEARLNKAVAEKEAVAAELAEAREVAKRDTGAASLAEARSAVDQLREQLERTAQELDVAKRISTESRAELQKQMAMAREAQEKYQRELLLHAKDIEELTTLKSSMTARQAELSEIEEGKRVAEEARDRAVAVMAETEAKHKAEYEKLKEQFGVVEEENKSLHDQLGTVTQQMTSLQKHFEGDPNASRSFSEDESRSTEQLMQIIKYLRREKEILSSKIDVVQAESVRIKSQMEVKERELSDATQALSAERAKGSSSEISSGRYADLLQKVQTVSALTDSNRMLREEKSKLNEELAEAKTENMNLTTELAPLREKVRTTDEREEALKLEMQALRQDNAVWKTRAEQLVEKQQKINPEELKKLQENNSELTKKLSTMNAQLQKGLQSSIELGNKCKAQQEELGKNKAELAQKQEEVNKLSANIDKLRTNAQAKLNNLGANVRERDATIKQLQADKETLAQELEKERSSAKVEGEKKVAEVSKTLEEINTVKATLAQKEGEINQLRKQNDERQTTVLKLRKIGRDYKERYENVTKELNELKASGAEGQGGASAEELAKLREEINNLEEENKKQLELLDEANAQIGEHEDQVKEYEEKIEELNDQVEGMTEKVDKFKDVLSKIKTSTTQPPTTTEMAAEIDKRIRLEEEFDSFKRASERQIKILNQDKATLNKERIKERRELQTRIEELEKKGMAASLQATAAAAEKPAPETVSVKPQVSSAPKQPQQQPRQKQAIQAHVQPSLRPHPPATATIRPQRGVPRAAAAAAPQSQSPSSSDATVPQVTVPPTVVSVSPSQQSTSAAPSTSTVPPAPTSVAAPIAPASNQAQQLNAAATEFVPRTVEAAPSVAVASAPVTAAAAVVTTTEQPATATIEEVAPTSTASPAVPSQQEPPQVQQEAQEQQPDSSAGPSQGPSTSAAKRPRDQDEIEDVESKKARTAEGGTAGDGDVVVVVSSDEEEEGQDQQPMAQEGEGDEDGEEDEDMGAEEEDDGVEDEEAQDEGGEEEVGDEEEDEDVEDVEEVEGVENVDEDSSSQLRIAEEDEAESQQADMEVVGEEEDSQAEMPPVASESSQQNVFASAEAVPEQQPDDGVVPSPQEMSSEPPVEALAAPAAAAAVSVAPPTFQFASTAAPTAAAASSAATSMDSTSVDFSQFSGSAAQPPSFAALAAQVPGGRSSAGIFGNPVVSNVVEPAVEQPPFAEEADVVEIEPIEPAPSPAAPASSVPATTAVITTAPPSAPPATTAAQSGQPIQVLTSTAPPPSNRGARGGERPRIQRARIVFDLNTPAPAPPTSSSAPPPLMGQRGARGGGGRARRSRGLFSRGGGPGGGRGGIN